MREGGPAGAAEWLGSSKRSVNRWLAGAGGMAPATRKLLRLLAWLLSEGVDLVALAERDRGAFEQLREAAETGEEPILDGREGLVLSHAERNEP